jgi:osmotically-inducible protein OsmY
MNGAKKRIDADIARSVKNILEWNVFIPKDSVGVMVENGWVTVSGHVAADYQRRTAESSIRCLSGVTGVSNQIILKPIVIAAVIKTDIEATLKRRAIAEADAIHVYIHNHEVTLSGKANNLAER